MNDLPVGYDAWKAPDPPDNPPRKHCDEDYNAGMCWTCFSEFDEIQPLKITYTRTDVYGPSDDGESNEEWALDCPVSAHHSPGVYGDPYTLSQHYLQVLVDIRELNSVREQPSWLFQLDKLIAHWEREVEGEQP